MYRFTLSAISCAAMALAQSTPARYNIPLSDPARPARVHIEMLSGSVHVGTHTGKDVILEVTTTPGKERGPDSKGLRRVEIAGAGLEATEKNNLVHIESGQQHGAVNLNVLVPESSSVKAELVQSGDLRIEGVQGNIEAENVNGKVILTDVAGAVVAESVNGGISVSFTRVPSDKPMSFTTVNGAIDVTMPADTKATVKLRTENGSVYTDFDLALQPGQVVSSPGGRDKHGNFKITMEHAAKGTINGGGVEMRLESVNGSLTLKKK